MSCGLNKVVCSGSSLEGITVRSPPLLRCCQFMDCPVLDKALYSYLLFSHREDFQGPEERHFGQGKGVFLDAWPH